MSDIRPTNWDINEYSLSGKTPEGVGPAMFIFSDHLSCGGNFRRLYVTVKARREKCDYS